MTPEEPRENLSEISTIWPDLIEARRGQSDNASHAAQVRLFRRYGPAVNRYLRAILRDGDAADDLYQTFALRFVRGDFQGVDPERGRFRDYLKSALFRLVFDYRRSLRKQGAPLSPDAPEPAIVDDPAEDLDAVFLASWRKQLIARTWRALAAESRRSSQSLYEVLTFKTDHPDLRSAQIAEHFGDRLGRPVKAEWVRKRLHLARAAFADLMLREVSRTIGTTDRAAIEEELIDLGLLELCRDALDRRRAGS